MKSCLRSVVLISVFILTGCSGGGGGSGDGATPPSVTPPSTPTYVTKDFTISMSEASVHRISNGDTVEVDISDISSAGTVVVTQ
ncbi:hypothetical protein N9D43_02360 [Luminiphilus sp.]|nr:hypothetical protein [Luminiphilus sp.]